MSLEDFSTKKISGCNEANKLCDYKELFRNKEGQPLAEE